MMMIRHLSEKKTVDDDDDFSFDSFLPDILMMSCLTGKKWKVTTDYVYEKSEMR